MTDEELEKAMAVARKWVQKYSWCRAECGFDDALSYINEALVRAHHTYDSSKSSVQTWTWRLCKHRSIDHLRTLAHRGLRGSDYGWRRGRVCPPGLELCDDETMGSVPSSAPPPDALLERQQRVLALREAITDALRDLVPWERDAIRATLDGMSVSEISEAMCLKAKSVSTYTSTGRRKLRENDALRRAWEMA